MADTEPVELEDIEARVYRTGNNSDLRGDADVIIPGDRILGSGSISKRLQEWAGDAVIAWDSTEDALKGAVTVGDRVELVYTVYDPDRGDTTSGYGDDGYGEGFYGGVDPHVTRSFTGWARSPSFQTYGGTIEDGQRVSRSEVELTEYVFAILGNRTVYGAFEGEASEIVSDIVALTSPEIDAAGAVDTAVTTDVEYDGREAKEAIVEVAGIADAIVSSSGRSLTFEPLGDIPTKFELEGADHAEISGEIDPSSLANSVRVDGGSDIRVDEATAEDAADIASYQTVTENDRITYELDPEKHRLDRIDVWVQDTGSGEGVRVRVQAPNADGTAPRNEDDDTLDIVGDSSGAVLPTDGWRNRFRLSREALPPNPWVIIESTGLEGQNIGLNAAGNPAIRTHYPYRIAIEVDDADSIDRYGLVERSYTDDSLSRFATARDIGESTLEHNKHPNVEIVTEALSGRSRALEAGDVVDVDMREYGVEEYLGRFIVMERTESIEAMTVRTYLTLQSVASL